MFVVLAKNIPLESAVCSPAEDVSWGGVYLHKGKTNVPNTSRCLRSKHVKLNDEVFMQVK